MWQEDNAILISIPKWSDFNTEIVPHSIVDAEKFQSQNGLILTR